MGERASERRREITRELASVRAKMRSRVRRIRKIRDEEYDLELRERLLMSERRRLESAEAAHA